MAQNIDDGEMRRKTVQDVGVQTDCLTDFADKFALLEPLDRVLDLEQRTLPIEAWAVGRAIGIPSSTHEAAHIVEFQPKRGQEFVVQSVEI